MAHSTKLWSPLRRLAAPSLCRAFSTTRTDHAKWGFIGLGQMGYNMATNLQAKLPSTDTIFIHDINTDATQRFLAEKSSGGANVEIAETVRAAAQDAETVITVLPETKHLENVIALIIKDSDHADKTHADRLFIDCSTVDPIRSRAVANVVQTQHQGVFVDAPMSGGVVGAKAGSLTFMLGAPQGLVPRIEPILQMMGKKIWHCGDQGAGLAGKLANNYLLAIENIAAAEAMNLGIKLGLEPAVLGNLINSCTGACWPTHTNNPVKGVVPTSASNRDYDGGFGVSLMKKDLTLALNAAKEANAQLELGDKAAEVYNETEKEFKGKDFSVVYRYIGGDK